MPTPREALLLRRLAGLKPGTPQYVMVKQQLAAEQAAARNTKTIPEDQAAKIREDLRVRAAASRQAENNRIQAANAKTNTNNDPYQRTVLPKPTARRIGPAGYRGPTGTGTPAYRQAFDPRTAYPTDSQAAAAPKRTAAEAQAILDQVQRPRRAAKGVAVKPKGEHMMPAGGMMKDSKMPPKAMPKKAMPHKPTAMKSGGAVKTGIKPVNLRAKPKK